MKIKTLGNTSGLRSEKSPGQVTAMLDAVCQASGLSLLEEIVCEERRIPVLCTAPEEKSRFSPTVWVNPAAPGFSMGYRELPDGCFCIFCDMDSSFPLKKTIIKQSELIRTAFLLLCEHLFPGNLLCYDEEASSEAEAASTVVPALRWLRQLFPEESFDQILAFRTSPALRVWIQNHLTQEDSPEKVQDIYLRSSLFHDTTTEIRYLYDLYSEFMEQNDISEILDSSDTMINPDYLYPFGPSTSKMTILLALHLNKALREAFQFDGPNRDDEICRAISSLYLMRNGTGSSAAQEWKKYRFPEQTALLFYCVEWECIIKILSYLSRLPEQRVRELADLTLPQCGEDSRVCLHGVLRDAKLAELRLQYTQSKDNAPYLSRNPDSTPALWNMERVFEKGIPSYHMYHSFRESCPPLSGEETTQLYTMAERLAKEHIYMTKELFSVLLNGTLERDPAVYAAVKTICTLYPGSGWRSVSEFLSFMDHTELRRQCLGF